jgi:hypothetical protein
MIRWLAFGLLLMTSASQAAPPEYSPDLTTWREVKVPPVGRNAERVVWNYAANYSPLSWRVYLDNGRPNAELIASRDDVLSDRPPFEATADGWSGAKRFAAVDDGWLVGFNYGEFGAALYWFGPDGQRHYKISDHQIVAFFSRADGVYAIEGLSHLVMSCGSIIRITRPTSAAHWQARRFVKLPSAPETIAARRDGTLLVTLNDSLVSVGPRARVNTLIPDAPWRGLDPSSSVLSPDERRLYVGMGQFVGEVDLATNQLRLLVPAPDLLNELPEDDEKRIRSQYADGMSRWRPPADICKDR